MSTPSVTDDQDPLQGIDERESGASEAEEPRGRSPTVDPLKHEVDPRNMSPRRNSEELAQLGAETKAKLEAYVISKSHDMVSWSDCFFNRQAQTLQSGLLALLERVEKARQEQDKLEGENRFLQEYDLTAYSIPGIAKFLELLLTNTFGLYRYIGSLMATSKITGSAPGSRSRNPGGRLK
jgi:hypothetical protein